MEDTLKERLRKIWRDNNGNPDKAMQSAYNLALSERWVPIADYPKDSSPKVLRWHHVWKCYVTVSHRRENTSNGCEWIDGTLTVVWPEAAFTPFFILPTPPQTKD